MHIIWDLSLQALEVITLVIGILGITISLLLLVSPKLVMSISGMFNRYFDLDKKMSYLDKDIRIDDLIYRHNIVSGVCLIFGSAFILVYLFYRFDERNLISALFGSLEFDILAQILVKFLTITGKLVGLIGIMAGSILLFTPNNLRAIEAKLNIWFSTDPLVEKLEQTQGDIDTIVYNRPIVFGLIGLITSIYLTFLAFNNIIS